MDISNLSSNWKKLQKTLSTQPKPIEQSHKRKVEFASTNDTKKARQMDSKALNQTGDVVNGGLSQDRELGKYIAIDCEMVGIGSGGVNSALARVSAVNYEGQQIYDSFVKPRELVTDWRTHVSGITPKCMLDARSFEAVQAEISGLLKDRVLVGHSLRNDLDVLFLSHPRHDTRDTATHAQYRQLAGGGYPKLKILASELLGIDIQGGSHSSLEDARACMLLFRRDKDAFAGERSGKRAEALDPGAQNRTTQQSTGPHKPVKKKRSKRT